MNKPNIIFFLTDDQTYWSMKSMGRTEVKTPNLDGLAGKGIIFDRYYNTSAICMASRASILTGKYEYNIGCNFEHGCMTKADFIESYPVKLREAGYFTGFAGKVGFNVSESGAEEDKHINLKEYFDMFGGLKGGQGFYETALNPNIERYSNEFPHSTRALGKFGMDFLNEAKDRNKPFCLSISFKAPHNPMTPDPYFDDIYKDTVWKKPGNHGIKGAKHLAKHIQTGRQWKFFDYWNGDEVFQEHSRKYHQLIHGVDYAVGMIMDELKSQGKEKETIIIFTSDNGFSHGSHHLGGKVLSYEESTRVPLIIYDPRVENKCENGRCREITANIDIAPTILDFAGIKDDKKRDGRSIVPLLYEKNIKHRDYIALYNFWNAPPTQVQSIVWDRYKYIFYWYEGEEMKVTEELFDLIDDPLEMKNIIKESERKNVLDKIRKIYDKQIEVMERDGIKDKNYGLYSLILSRKISFADKEKVFLNYMDSWLERCNYGGGEWLEDVEKKPEWKGKVRELRKKHSEKKVIYS